MITIDNDGEFTYTIMDLIVKLSELDKFALKIWTNLSELAYEFDERWSVHFMQESIRFSMNGKHIYVAMDSIVSIILSEGEL